jgi:hypothetical protein
MSKHLPLVSPALALMGAIANIVAAAAASANPVVFLAVIMNIPQVFKIRYRTGFSTIYASLEIAAREKFTKIVFFWRKISFANLPRHVIDIDE